MNWVNKITYTSTKQRYVEHDMQELSNPHVEFIYLTNFQFSQPTCPHHHLQDLELRLSSFSSFWMDQMGQSATYEHINTNKNKVHTPTNAIWLIGQAPQDCKPMVTKDNA